MPESTDPADVYEALFALQAERIVLAKDQTGQVGQQKTKYADLVQANEVILPRLFALGLLWLTSPTLRMIPGPNGQEDPRFVLDWTMRHVPSGTSIEGTYPLMDAGTAMKAGSAITYARRYALVAITNAVAQDEDDDGRGGAGRGRPGYAQRNVVPPRPVADRPATAQRDQRPARGEKSRPTQEPEPPTPMPAPVSPAASGEPHRGRGGLITMPMAGLLSGEMKRLGFSDNERLPYVADLVNRSITSSKDLTYDEGSALIDALKKAAGSDDPKMKAAEIYIRITTGVPNDEPAAARPTKKAARPAESRPVAEQTRDAVLGRPAGPNDRAPWDDDQTLLDEPPAEWPETAAPGGQR